MEQSERPRWPGGRLYFVASFYSSGSVSELVLKGPEEPPEDASEFLFALPEYGHGFKSVLDQALDELTLAKSPVLRNIRLDRSQRVRTTHITAPSGEVVSNPPIEVALPYRFTISDVTGFDLDALARSCDEAAEVLTDTKLDALLDYSGRISEALGNVSDAGGQPFGWPVLLLIRS